MAATSEHKTEIHGLIRSCPHLLAKAHTHPIGRDVGGEHHVCEKYRADEFSEANCAAQASVANSGSQSKLNR
jgi:hypothetical protein